MGLPPKEGLFIVFDGPDGGGKTTQIERLRTRLQNRGEQILKTREIGGTPEAEKLRNLIVRKTEGDWLPLSALLLAFTARYEHTEKVIKPALNAGITVLSDRYADSTYLYQAIGQGAGIEAFQTIYALTLGTFEPDITFILDVDPITSLKRAKSDIQMTLFHERKTEKMDDRFEMMDLSFHEGIRKGYLDIARRNPHRCVVIDAAQDMDKVEQDIWAALSQKMGLS